MRTTTLVQANADVVTIVNLRAGDVYKRLEENKSGYGEKYKLEFGIVTDVLHNGEDAVITAVEFDSNGWSNVEPKLKTFGTDADLKLFAAQPDEVRAHFTDVIQVADRAVEAARTELVKKTDIFDRITRVAARADSLTAAATSTAAVEQ